MSTGKRWVPPSIHAPAGQPVTFVELFFDLVFVFALTEITGFTAHHLDTEGVFRATVMFWMIWWGWTQWTWALNPADTENAMVRVGTLAATAVASLMAVSVGDAFDDDSGGLWFIVPYLLVRIGGLALYARVASERAGHFEAVRAFALLSTAGLVVAFLGGLVEPAARQWLWLGVIVLDLAAAGLAGRRATWHLHAAHFAERHGLFVIIALGESLIVAAAAVAGAEKTDELVFVAMGAVTLTCLMWWTYFGWFKEALEARLAGITAARQGEFARDAYSVLHFFLVCGIVGVAVSFEEMTAHPGDRLEDEVLGSLAVGMVLFLGASAVAWARAYRRVLWPRLAIPAGIAAALVVAHDAQPAWLLVISAAGLVVLIAVEESTRDRAKGEPGMSAVHAHEPGHGVTGEPGAAHPPHRD